MGVHMEFNKNVSNPMLVGAIELMKAEDTPEHRGMFVEELAKAEFLSPAMVNPAPAEGADGELIPCCPLLMERSFSWRLRTGRSSANGRRRTRRCLRLR